MYRLALTFLAWQLVACSPSQDTSTPQVVCTKLCRKSTECTPTDEGNKVACRNGDEPKVKCVLMCDGEKFPYQEPAPSSSKYDSSTPSNGRSILHTMDTEEDNKKGAAHNTRRRHNLVRAQYNQKLRKYLQRIYSNGGYRQKREVSDDGVRYTEIVRTPEDTTVKPPDKPMINPALEYLQGRNKRQAWMANAYPSYGRANYRGDRGRGYGSGAGYGGRGSDYGRYANYGSAAIPYGDASQYYESAGATGRMDQGFSDAASDVSGISYELGG